MRRFLRDAAVALFVGAVLIALAMVLNVPSEESPPHDDSTAAQQATDR